MLLSLCSFTPNLSERQFSRISLNLKALASVSLCYVDHYYPIPFLCTIIRFGNVTNGGLCRTFRPQLSIQASLTVTPRRWLDQCNPELSNLITKKLKLDKSVWLKNLTKLEDLLPLAEDKKFRKEWAAVKQRNKERLARHVQSTLGFTVQLDAMFDVQIKVRFLEDLRIEKLVLLTWQQ